MSEKRFIIECTEKQLQMIDAATELQCRLICGQMWLGPVQDIFMDAFEKAFPDKSWQDIRSELEEDMKMLQKKYFNLSPNASYGLGHDNYADNLWSIHKCCEHARWLALPQEDKEKTKWSVMADPPMQYGDQPLMKVELKHDRLHPHKK